MAAKQDIEGDDDGGFADDHPKGGIHGEQMWFQILLCSV